MTRRDRHRAFRLVHDPAFVAAPTHHPTIGECEQARRASRIAADYRLLGNRRGTTQRVAKITRSGIRSLAAPLRNPEIGRNGRRRADDRDVLGLVEETLPFLCGDDAKLRPTLVGSTVQLEERGVLSRKSVLRSLGCTKSDELGVLRTRAVLEKVAVELHLHAVAKTLDGLGLHPRARVFQPCTNSPRAASILKGPDLVRIRHRRGRRLRGRRRRLRRFRTVRTHGRSRNNRNRHVGGRRSLSIRNPGVDLASGPGGRLNGRNDVGMEMDIASAVRTDENGSDLRIAFDRPLHAIVCADGSSLELGLLTRVIGLRTIDLVFRKLQRLNDRLMPGTAGLPDIRRSRIMVRIGMHHGTPRNGVCHRRTRNRNRGRRWGFHTFGSGRRSRNDRDGPPVRRAGLYTIGIQRSRNLRHNAVLAVARN